MIGQDHRSPARTSTCRTAATSRTSASTRWSCAAAASSSCQRRRLRSRLPLRRPRQRDPQGPARLRRRRSTSRRASASTGVGAACAAPASRSGRSGTRPPTRRAADGVLLYVKAALCGDEPVDVCQLRRGATRCSRTSRRRTSGSTKRSSRATACSALHTVAVTHPGTRVHSVAELCATAGARQAAVVPRRPIL